MIVIGIQDLSDSKPPWMVRFKLAFNYAHAACRVLGGKSFITFNYYDASDIVRKLKTDLEKMAASADTKAMTGEDNPTIN